MTLQGMIDQIKPLSETIARDVNELLTLLVVPFNNLLRAYSCLWLALIYDVFSVFEPHSIKVPMLDRISGFNMQGFCCICAW
jgi:hypothetical protein